jgi:uncharacterized protein (DUF1800 family)
MKSRFTIASRVLVFGDHMHPDAARIAHLMRRTGFGPAPGEVDAAGSYEETLARVLDTAIDDGTEIPDPNDDDITPGIGWWLNRMRTTPAPLHEKMVLFWHGHLTSSADKASADMLANQHNVFRRLALGNFRELIHAIVRDAAMLIFLDSAGSSADDPNENLGRELMELFTLGRGAYTQSDVRAAARALAGFTVDWESEAVGFDEEAANSRSLTVLGVTDTFDADRLADVICDHDACAPFIAGKLYRFFVGVPAPEARLGELAAGFRDSDLELRPLVEAILTGREFSDSRLTRPRFPVEWYVAAMAALDVEIVADEVWNVGELGQLPFYPPNVAGWPVGLQWLSAGRQLLRASMTLDRSWVDDYSWIDLGGSSPRDRAAAALERCGLFEVAQATVDGIEAVARRVPADEGGDRLLVALALASPEAACC